MFSKFIANFEGNYHRGGQFIDEGIELEDRNQHDMHDPEMQAYLVNLDDQNFRMAQQKEAITSLIVGVWD